MISRGRNIFPNTNSVRAWRRMQENEQSFLQSLQGENSSQFMSLSGWVLSTHSSVSCSWWTAQRGQPFTPSHTVFLFKSNYLSEPTTCYTLHISCLMGCLPLQMLFPSFVCVKTFKPGIHKNPLSYLEQILSSICFMWSVKKDLVEVMSKCVVVAFRN